MGSTIKFGRRKTEHWNHLKNQVHRSSSLQQGYNELGKNCFEFIVLEVFQKTDKKRLLEREDFYIRKCNSLIPNGYNSLTATRKKPSPRHKEILLEANKKSQKFCHKRVGQYDINGKLILYHKSINRAVKFLFPEMTENEITYARKGTTIGKCCNGGAKTAFGFIWKFI